MAREYQFYIVPTPIGNMGDITLRALEVLNSVDIIACEDTRVTQKLLNNYKINKKCVSYHKYNEKERIDFFMQELDAGKKIALVSDAGTPMICDPGAVIVKELTKNKITITSLPGASAITTFASQIPRTNEEFTFVGFAPRAEKKLEEMLKTYANQNIMFYDSPERILKTIENIKKYKGDIQISVGRELSKLFEEVVTGKITKILEHFKDGIKGEIVCFIYKEEETQEDTEITTKIRVLKDKGFKDKDIAIILSSLFNYNKNNVYKKSLEI